MLEESQIEELRGRCKKIGRVEWEGHEVVFRRPTRTEWHEYLRQKGSTGESHVALEQLSQRILVAFDGEIDVTRARMAYTTVFLEECPGFANAPEVAAIIAVLAGTAQEEEIAHLGKVGTVSGIARPNTLKASPNGSATAVAPVTSSDGTPSRPPN